jgi:hypothetical protein
MFSNSDCSLILWMENKSSKFGICTFPILPSIRHPLNDQNNGNITIDKNLLMEQSSQIWIVCIKNITKGRFTLSNKIYVFTWFVQILCKKHWN